MKQLSVLASIKKASLVLATIAATTTFATLSTAAISDEQVEGGTDLFSTLDADNNEVITPDEAIYLEPLMAQFNELDTNKDGMLTQKEFDALSLG